MDVSFVALIISCVGLLSSCEAQFPFQSGPLLYDPYASFFGSNELNPFASNDMRIAVPTQHHSHHYFPKRQSDRPQRDRPQEESIADHRDYHRKMFEREPSKWRKFSKTSYTEGPTQKNYKKLLAPVPKLNDYNKELIRPRPESEVDSIGKHISYQRNHFNSKPVMNYKNSNSFRESVSPNSLFRDNHSSNRGSEKRTDRDSDDEPSTLDIDLDGDEDNEPHIHNRNYNDNHDRDLGENRRDRSRVQFSSPPERSTPFKPHNYQIKEKAYTFDNTQHKRPALYEIEAPKNLDRNRPSTNGPTFIQNIPVPHQTLLEIAEITGPPRTSTSRRPHPFEGFNQRPSKPKPEAEIIVNSLDGMTRQVGASMSVQLEERKFQPKGKIFDEPIAGSERRQSGGSYQQIPFRPNEGNPFNSKHFNSFGNNNNNNNNDNDFRSVNKPKSTESPFPYAQPKSDDDYDDGSYDEHDHEENEPPIFSAPKQSNNYKREESNRRQQKELYSEQSSQRPPAPKDSEEDRPNDDIDSSEEWTSNGIPGQPGKDYPMLSGVPLTSAFSCLGRPHGFYADISQKCQVYHQCSAQGSQKFLCPNGTLFSQESLVCEWWYNVVCENSEQLYHKNEQLYRNDDRKQNDDISNDENRRKPNEYNKSWNFQKNNNNNNPNGYQNRNKDNNDNYNNNNNHNPRNHYINNNNNNNINNNFRENNSDRNRVHTRGPPSGPPDPDYDEEVDVELSNDESRNRFVKVVSNHPLVSKVNQINSKNKNKM